RLIDERTILVANKTDLVNGSLTEIGGIPVDHAVSVRTGDGIDAFLVALEDHVSSMLSGHEGVVPTRARHREALAQAAEALDRAVAAKLPELAAEDIRLAVRALGRITGRVDIDEMLDAVFRDFCIGK
ncbi:MAG: tRNA uridine-5-carboxymethylaminomethyl(34) synthesis GTPase MnmE, partial [Alphaproteobacteria bacterium]